MTDLTFADLPYQRDSALLFNKIAGEPWSVFIDSNRPAGTQGRYDIMVARPDVCITTQDCRTKIQTCSQSYTVLDGPFTVLREQLPETGPNTCDLPFAGGALGFFSYDLCRYMEKIPSVAANDVAIPDMVIGIYSWAVVVDHSKMKSVLVGDCSNTRTKRCWNGLVKLFTSQANHKKHQEFRVNAPISSNMTRDYYGNAFRKIKQYILEGDCYQVNLAQRFTTDVEGDPWLAYQVLRKINPSPFSAYMNYPEFQVLSNSPEQFLSVKDGMVKTRPIKGTRPRSQDQNKDRCLAKELALSVKDQAENLMIVDLLRNDISKNCALGSVQVQKLFDIESFPNVHHMVSTITGKLRAHRSAMDLLRGCFPGGSITGAPKIRSMEVIEELEPHRRGIYCGSIGYIGFDGNMDINIAIRTILHRSHQMYFYAGGGIVFDSDEDAEYQETFDKAAAMMNLLGENKVYAMGS
ncbi:MAG: aminodeoxychorismate synthase component I [Gammaproteobacteria bacterium]|nr:aminodeoxychorismate synthase component I [Gammaproteobacteria bacterium]